MILVNRKNHSPSSSFFHLGDPFLYTGTNVNSTTSTTLTIPPEQDPNSIFLNITLPTSTTTRKRKNANLAEGDRPANPTGAKRGRHRTKNLPPVDDMEWAPTVEKRPPKSTTKRPPKQTIPPPPSSATTSILNTLLQLPSHQPKQRTNDSNLLKTIHQPPSFVNTILSSNPFL